MNDKKNPNYNYSVRRRVDARFTDVRRGDDGDDRNPTAGNRRAADGHRDRLAVVPDKRRGQQTREDIQPAERDAADSLEGHLDFRRPAEIFERGPNDIRPSRQDIHFFREFISEYRIFVFDIYKEYILRVSANFSRRFFVVSPPGSHLSRPKSRIQYVRYRDAVIL